ncbi:hypothetical protein [Pseudoalteromonas sp. 68 DY56-GL68]|uniref:hypothetical protein n=1 Tax=Pseudoalteromonas sp. 68 DY56-GL68 TaxID=2974919 RepID=UPI00352AA88F
MDELSLKDFIFIIVQVVLITSVIITNKIHIGYLRKQNEGLKECIDDMQKIITELRVKIGI